MKLLFLNRYDVCFHGTPAPELFAQGHRDTSHGCPRAEDHAALALIELWLCPTGAIALPSRSPLSPGRSLTRLDLVFALMILPRLTVSSRDADVVGTLGARTRAGRMAAARCRHTRLRLLLCLARALLSALMSKTGTASFLIPLAATVGQEYVLEVLRRECGRAVQWEPTRIASGFGDKGAFPKGALPVEVKAEYRDVGCEHIRAFPAQPDRYATDRDRVAYLLNLDVRAEHATA